MKKHSKCTCYRTTYITTKATNAEKKTIYTHILPPILCNIDHERHTPDTKSVLPFSTLTVNGDSDTYLTVITIINSVLFIYLFIHLFVYLFIYLFIYLYLIGPYLGTLLRVYGSRKERPVSLKRKVD